MPGTHQLRTPSVRTVVGLTGLLIVAVSGNESWTRAQPPSPTMLHPNLGVRALVTGLTQPTSIAFIGENDLFVLEKSTGQVKRVVDGAVQSTVLDLAVNFGSERGLLGIALHPDFPGNPGVYLYWTESTGFRRSCGTGDEEWRTEGPGIS